MTPSLIIAGRSLSIVGWLDYTQTIEAIGGASVRRLANGGAFKSSRWQKYRIAISAGGWVPPALLGIDYTLPFEVELPMPVALIAGESLPAGWASRAAPWVEHSVTDQAGVVSRFVYPKLTVIAEPPSQSHGHAGSPSWELTLEQV